MSESEETPVNTVPPSNPVAVVAAPSAPAPVVVAPPAALPVVTLEHISAIHRRIDEIGHAIKVGFEALFRFVRKEAPAVEAGAAAVSTVIPGVAPIAAAVETAAATAVAVVNCANAHGNPCLNRKCVNFNKETPPAP